MEFGKEIWRKYKYLILAGIFTVWITFFDSNSLLSLWEISSDAKTLRKESTFFKSEIEKARQQREHLFSNPKNLEKFARENYLMKKDDEDVFIIVEEKKK